MHFDSHIENADFSKYFRISKQILQRKMYQVYNNKNVSRIQTNGTKHFLEVYLSQNKASRFVTNIDTYTDNQTLHTISTIDPINISLHKHVKHTWEKNKISTPTHLHPHRQKTSQKQVPHTYPTFVNH